MRPATNSLRAPNPDATLRHPGAYSVVARFTDTLTADVNLFSIFIHGAFQERTNGNGAAYVFNDQTPGDGLALEATRLVRVTLTGVADTDGDQRLIFERRVHIQGCLLQPRGDQETQLGQKIFENLLARFCERIGPAPSDFLQLAGESCRVIGHCANALAEVPGGLSRIPDRQRGLKFCKRTPFLHPFAPEDIRWLEEASSQERAGVDAWQGAKFNAIPCDKKRSAHYITDPPEPL